MRTLARRGRAPRLAACIAAMAVAVPAAQGTDLWQIYVTNTDGSGIPDLTAGGSSLVDLLNDLVSAQGAFAAFAGAAFSADISIAGVADVINVTVDPGTNTATLQFTILGGAAQIFTFTGADLEGQIQQFLENNAADQLSAFIQALNALSPVAVTDGAPLSSTALSASYTFERFGLHADFTRAERRAASEIPFKAGLRGRVDAYYGHFDIDPGEGDSYAIAPSLEYAFDEHVSLALLFPINYMSIEGSDILNAQVTLAVPWTILAPGMSSPWGVRVTGFGTISMVGSADLVSGGILGGGGVLGTVTLALDRMTLSFSTQISDHEGIVLQYQGFEFDPGVSQEIVKNGLKATFYIGDDLYLYASGVYTSFLQDAAVDNYWTPGAGLGWRTGNGFNVSVGYSGDLADGYRSDTLRLTVQLPF